MRSNLNMSSLNEAILFSGDSIIIKVGCEIKKDETLTGFNGI